MAGCEVAMKRSPIELARVDQTTEFGHVISVFLSLIYREFCKARLAEMRKHQLAGY